MPVVAIDGPVGAGKTTIARAVGAALGLPVLETGAMYRAVAWAALQADNGDPAGLAEVARSIDIETGERVMVDGVDVTAALRGADVGQLVSTVASVAGVRAALVERQRRWVVERGGGVVEGRDIGTVVFPEADLKVFLTASSAERARRRAADESPADVERRDTIDSSRSVSPLAAAADAVVVDTTGRPVEGIVSEIVALWDGRGKGAVG